MAIKNFRRKQIELESSLFDRWGIKSVLKRKHIGLESALIIYEG
jgi:hypothetical protein